MTTRYPRIRYDLRRLGLGVVQITTRARTRREHDRRVVLFDDLVNDGQIAVIRALLAGEVTWEALVDAKRRKTHHGDVLADVKLNAKLDDAIAATITQMGKSPATRKRYELSLRQLRVTARGAGLFPADAKVAALLELDWSLLAAEWTGRSAADWNHVLRAVSAFLSRYLGKRSAVAAQVREAMTKTRRRESPRVPDLSVALFHRIVAAARLDVQAPLWCLALTGLRDRSEYLRCTKAHLMPETLRLRVPGTKTEGSADVLSFDREDWPYIANAIPSPLRYKALRAHWIKACVVAGAGTYIEVGRTAKDEPILRYRGLQLHDLRHFCAQQAEGQGVPLSKIRQQLRHATIATTERYARTSSTKAVARAVGGALRDGLREHA